MYRLVMIYLAAAVALLVVFFILHSTNGEDGKQTKTETEMTPLIRYKLMDQWEDRQVDVNNVPLGAQVITDDQIHPISNKPVTEIKVHEGYTAYLFHMPHDKYDDYPNYEPPVVYTSTDSESVHSGNFTHFALRDHPNATYVGSDVRCNRMRLAVENREWPADCIPDYLRDTHDCGYTRKGYKIGNYRGIPTECNRTVGNTWDGTGVYADPVYGVRWGSQLGSPVLKYPMTIPIFLADGQLSTERQEAECEHVYVCKVDTQEEHDRFRAGLQDSDAVTQWLLGHGNVCELSSTVGCVN